MMIRTTAALAAVAALAGCTTPYGPGLDSGPVSTAFNEADFAWSALGGQGGVDGSVAFTRDGQAYGCTGSVALTPDTPYTRARFQTLYGSTEQAAVPEAVIRARTVADPNADYRSYVRSSTCADNRFALTGLPDGSWFAIVPVATAAGGERIVLMRRLETRGGRTVRVIF